MTTNWLNIFAHIFEKHISNFVPVFCESHKHLEVREETERIQRSFALALQYRHPLGKAINARTKSWMLRQYCSFSSVLRAVQYLPMMERQGTR